MNREIKFRGKRKDNGEWVFGNLINWLPALNPRIIWREEIGEHAQELDFNETNFEVLPESVGQLSNQLTKKAGFEIYEGDTIEFDLHEGLGEPRTNNHTETISSIEDNFYYYINIRLKS